MQLPIIKYGSSILRQLSLEVKPEDNYRDLIDDLFYSLNPKEGIGLAAPQIGVLKRVFVVVVPFKDDEQKDSQLFKKAFINPTILWKRSERVIYNEGCLSIPDIFENVLRPEKITVTYFDKNFSFIVEDLNGIIARVFQHEYDHLNGVLFIDQINPLKRRLLSNKLNRIKKNK
jgi:peptide deformylase